jgi:hypothetical protein
MQQAPVFPCCVPSVLFRGIRGVPNHVCETLDTIYQQQINQVTLRQTSKKAWSTPIFQISMPEISNDMHKIGAIRMLPPPCNCALSAVVRCVDVIPMRRDQADRPPMSSCHLDRFLRGTTGDRM